MAVAAPSSSTTTTVTATTSAPSSSSFNDKNGVHNVSSHKIGNDNDDNDVDDKYLWNMTIQEIKKWLYGSYPLFPKPIKLTNVDPVRSPSISMRVTVEESEQREKQQKQREEFARQIQISERLLENLGLALQSASSISDTTQLSSLPRPSFESESESELQLHPNKRMKLEIPQSMNGGGGGGSSLATTAATTNTTSSSAVTSSHGRDLYNILDPSFAQGDHIIHQPGTILARLTIGGWINALSGRIAGVVNVQTAKPLSNTTSATSSTATNTTTATTNNNDTVVMEGITLGEIRKRAMGLSHVVSARLEVDMMRSTPKRIVEMTCPEVTMEEITGIRKRIYDTVILGKGTNASANAAALESSEGLPVAARVGMHDIDKFKRCKVCGNNDQGSFVLDKKNGDLICMECGTVATESLMHEGTQFRKFEGEEDRNHHGDTANPLYSNAYNMGTSLSGVSMAVGAGIGGYGSGGKKGMETILKNIHNYTEMNISQFGKEEKKTRLGYKDRQKKEAFVQMTHIADALSLHQAVLQRAKELFAGFRDDRELVQQFKGVLAACLCEAFDQLSKDGQQILKVKAAENKCGGLEDVSLALNSRATRRSELHSSSLAGSSGVFLNDTQTSLEDDSKSSSVDDNLLLSDLEKKPASTWTLDDTRSWLLDASKNIAKQWHERQIEELKPGSKVVNGSTPKGTKAEMEGLLVQHTLTLCGFLEEELKSNAKDVSSGNRQRVVTPRVNEMGHLGIKWQHKHERGSGGAGGIGNNAMRGNPQQNGNGRTAGQILILKTAKKLSQILNDDTAGEAFHRELRALLNRQEAMKNKELRNIASLQRLNQMKRKPWVQARVTQR